MIVMAGIQFTIGKNRLEKTFLDGMERDGDTGILCSEKEGVHYMILPLLDSGIQDCPWGRMTFHMELSEDTVCYLYLCAMNEPKGQDIMMDPERGFTEKVEFLSSNRCLKFINKTDVLLYEIEGRYLWIALEIIGEGGKVENIVVQAPGDNFMQTFPEVYREKNSFMHRYLSIGSAPSTINCIPVCLEAKSSANTTAMSAFWFRIICSASLGTETTATISKYSEADKRSTTACVKWSICETTITVRTFFTSVDMANPNINIIIIGIPKSISIVRLSRTMCFASLITNEMNCFIRLVA